MTWKAISTARGWQEWENDPGIPVAKVRIFSSIALKVEFKTKEEGRNFHKLFQGTDIPAHFPESTGALDHIVQILQDSPYLKDFLRKLLKFDPSIKEILPIILDQLKLSTSLGIDLNDLRPLTKAEAISSAIDAQKYGHHDLIWELFELYESDFFPQEGEDGEVLSGQNRVGITLDELYALANSISSDNSHYKEAQTKCAHLLMLSDLPETLDEQYELLELKFRHSVLGNDQKLTDLLFAQLCGLNLGEPSTQNIGPNVDTLCALAKVMRKLNQKPENENTHSNRFFNLK